MDKSSRLALIRSRFNARFGLPIPGILPVSKVEIREEALTIRGQRTVRPECLGNDTATTTDDGKPILSPSLRFDGMPYYSEKESDVLLSAKEKRTLAKEIALSRAEKRAVKENPVEVTGEAGEIFPSQENCEYESLIPASVRAYADFACDCDSLPLRLMA